MEIVITGAAGFLGRRLVAALLERGTATDSAGQVRPIERLIAFDRIPLDGFDDLRLVVHIGDIADPHNLPP